MEDVKFIWKRDNADALLKPNIHRIDNDGDYTIDNCQYIEQSKHYAGEFHNRHKLTTKEALEIRKFKEDNPDVFYTTIAKEYDVCATTISDIVNRKTWKHI